MFFKVPKKILKKIKITMITLQALRFKLNTLNKTCISLKSIMQLTKPIFLDSATFMEEKRVKKFCGEKARTMAKKKTPAQKNYIIRLIRPCPGTLKLFRCSPLTRPDTARPGLRDPAQPRPTDPARRGQTAAAAAAALAPTSAAQAAIFAVVMAGWPGSCPSTPPGAYAGAARAARAQWRR
jgi:hypothetical protein